MSTKWAILILFLAGLLVYGNTAKNGLFWDDDEFITRNEFIRSFRYLPQWFSQPLTAGAGVKLVCPVFPQQPLCRQGSRL